MWARAKWRANAAVLKKHQEGAHVALSLFGRHWLYLDIDIMQIRVGAFQGHSACKLRLDW